MALFFNARWFDEKLSAQGLTRTRMAEALGLTDGQLTELFKDQRELRARDVLVLADLLKVPAAEIADQAGVSTPVPTAPETASDLGAIVDRLDRLERLVLELKQLVLDRRS